MVFYTKTGEGKVGGRERAEGEKEGRGERGREMGEGMEGGRTEGQTKGCKGGRTLALRCCS